jgi:hypothetical protein
MEHGPLEVLNEEDIKPMMARRVFSVLEQVRLFTMGDMNYEAEYGLHSLLRN